MKRSEINTRIHKAADFFRTMGFRLPPWASWTTEDWKTNWSNTSEIRDNALGWDLTDFGSGEFDRIGLLLFTIRNGNYQNKSYSKPYAEKIMVVGEGQVTPMHYHWNKMEDIINRGGGNLQIQLFNASSDDKLGGSRVNVQMDGIRREVPAGAILTLTPGESISLTPKLFHKFWGEKGKGTVLVGEVSMVNDDAEDNNFIERCGRFPEVEEDEPISHPLCTEYDKLKS